MVATDYVLRTKRMRLKHTTHNVPTKDVLTQNVRALWLSAAITALRHYRNNVTAIFYVYGLI